MGGGALSVALASPQVARALVRTPTHAAAGQRSALTRVLWTPPTLASRRGRKLGSTVWNTTRASHRSLEIDWAGQVGTCLLQHLYRPRAERHQAQHLIAVASLFQSGSAALPLQL